MIICYITYPSYKKKLHKYFILNDTNFYPFLTEEKDDFILLSL